MHPRVTELHNIMPIANIASVLVHGILSHEKCVELAHTDVSMAAIQDKRNLVQVPGGRKLHQYANLYFHARNPMMYKRNHLRDTLCVLRISTDVLPLPGVVVSDQNASSRYVRFRPPEDLDSLNFDKIYADDWTHPNDPVAYWRHKSMKCAEVLVPDCVEPKYIEGAYVANEAARFALTQQGFSMSINVNPHIFLL